MINNKWCLRRKKTMSAEHLFPPTLLKLHVLLKQALWDWPGKFSALFPRLYLQGVVEVWETAQTCHGWSDCQPLVALSSAVLDTRQRHCEERVTKYMKSPWNRCIVYCIVLLSTWNIYKIIQIYTRTHSNPWRNQQRRTVSCCPGANLTSCECDWESSIPCISRSSFLVSPSAGSVHSNKPWISSAVKYLTSKAEALGRQMAAGSWRSLNFFVVKPTKTH